MEYTIVIEPKASAASAPSEGGDSPSKRESLALWRKAWVQAGEGEIARAGQAGFPVERLILHHKSPFPSPLWAAQKTLSLALGAGMGAAAVTLGPVMAFTKGKLPWFSRAVAAHTAMIPKSSDTLGILPDTQNLSLARIAVGPNSEFNRRSLADMAQGGLTEQQAREACLGHELGHLALARLMRDGDQRERLALRAAMAGVAPGPVEQSGGWGAISLPATAFVAGLPMALNVAGLAAGHPVLGVALCVGSFALGARAMGKRQGSLSAKIFEEGFADAFAALLPLAQSPPDRELAAKRARAFKSLRSSTYLGEEHGVQIAAGSLIEQIEQGALDALTPDELTAVAATSGAMAAALALSMAQRLSQTSADKPSHLLVNGAKLKAEADLYLRKGSAEAGEMAELAEQIARSYLSRRGGGVGNAPAEETALSELPRRAPSP